MTNLLSITSGEKKAFAISSSILTWIPESGGIALGSFMIFVNGVAYGKPNEDATLLACSLDAVKRRISMRGRHIPVFDGFAKSSEIASAYIQAMHRDPDGELILGLDLESFLEDLHGNNLIWAPDGDQAFDDGSIVLQFDLGEMVRVISFKISEKEEEPFTDLTDMFFEEHRFYGVLQDWLVLFEKAASASL